MAEFCYDSSQCRKLQSAEHFFHLKHLKLGFCLILSDTSLLLLAKMHVDSRKTV